MKNSRTAQNISQDRMMRLLKGLIRSGIWEFNSQMMQVSMNKLRKCVKRQDRKVGGFSELFIAEDLIS